MSGWSDAIADVTEQLQPLAVDPVIVYGHEPGNPGWRRPRAIVCSLGPLTAVDYGVMIRVYVSTNTAIDEAQTALTDLVIAVEDTLDGAIPRSAWQIVWLADENAWVCSTVALMPREDF